MNQFKIKIHFGVCYLVNTDCDFKCTLTFVPILSEPEFILFYETSLCSNWKGKKRKTKSRLHLPLACVITIEKRKCLERHLNWLVLSLICSQGDSIVKGCCLCVVHSSPFILWKLQTFLIFLNSECKWRFRLEKQNMEAFCDVKITVEWSLTTLEYHCTFL